MISERQADTRAAVPAREDSQGTLRRQLGEALNNDERYAGEAAYREAVWLDPTDAAAHQGLAVALGNQERSAETEEAFREAIYLNPASAAAHGWLSKSLRALGHYQDAEPECREAVRLDPGNARWHDTLAILLTDLGRYAEAEEPAKEAVRLSPGDQRIRRTKPSCLRSRKEQRRGGHGRTTADRGRCDWRRALRRRLWTARRCSAGAVRDRLATWTKSGG